MADDALISGGLFDITIRNAIPEASDAVTGDKANVTNMALANGLMLMWDYGERVNGQSSLIARDIEAIGLRRDTLRAMLDWTPDTFDSPNVAQANLNQLFDYGVGKSLTDQAVYATFPGAPSLFGQMGQIQFSDKLGAPLPTWSAIQLDPNPAARFNENVLYLSGDGYFFEFVDDGSAAGALRQLGRDGAGMNAEGVRWPARNTTLTDQPVGDWASVQSRVGEFAPGAAYLTEDGIYFYRDGNSNTLHQIDLTQADLVFSAVNVTEADIAQVRRELEIAIESMTQVNQDKQAFLQDLVASLQKWFTFVNSVCDRRKRDADTIVGNFR